MRLLVASWAARKPTIRAVWLIGSRAKQTARPDSDVDLAVAYRLPANVATDYWQHNDWAVELETLLDLPVHVLSARRKHAIV
jgi:predicted nucleotidyltransferase